MQRNRARIFYLFTSSPGCLRSISAFLSPALSRATRKINQGKSLFHSGKGLRAEISCASVQFFIRSLGTCFVGFCFSCGFCLCFVLVILHSKILGSFTIIPFPVYT